MRLRVRWYAKLQTSYPAPDWSLPMHSPAPRLLARSLFTMARTAESCTPDWVWSSGQYSLTNPSILGDWRKRQSGQPVGRVR
jgi:hypothetical protein